MPFSLIDLVESMLVLSFKNICTLRYTHLHPHLMKINTLILLFFSVAGKCVREPGGRVLRGPLLCGESHVWCCCWCCLEGVTMFGSACWGLLLTPNCTAKQTNLSVGAVLWCSLEDSSRLGFTKLSSLFPFKDFHSFGILFIFSIQLHHTALIIFIILNSLPLWVTQ